MGLIESTLGWLGDIVGTHVYRNDVPLPQRRRVSFDGPDWDISDDAANQVLRVNTLVRSGLRLGVQEVDLSGESGSVDDVVVTNYPIVYITPPEGGIAITGIVPPSKTGDPLSNDTGEGDVLILINKGADPIALLDTSTSSEVGNRFLLPADMGEIDMGENGVVAVVLAFATDGNLYWRVLSGLESADETTI